MRSGQHPVSILLLALCLTFGASSSAQSFSVVRRFNLSNGLQPGPLTLGGDGNFYGTTQYGGDLNTCNGLGCGTVFRLTPAGALTPLHSFVGSDGMGPQTVMQASDGNLYGTTFCSTLPGEAPPASSISLLRRTGSSPVDTINFCLGPGTFFRIAPDGTFTTLSLFNGPNGAAPAGSLLQTSDGNFYGTTMAGGANNEGVVFRITTSGSVTVLYSFAGPDGYAALGGLAQGNDGNFYGTTLYGGANGQGTVFKVTPSGTLTTLHNFNTSDGANPNGNLVLARDGNFYGTTQVGGANQSCRPIEACGTIFKITPGGTLSSLYNFSGPDGANPNSGLIQAADGNFYGTTQWGGFVYGAAFRYTPTGTLSMLHPFCAASTCPDGEAPEGPLVQDASGLLYGATLLGGNSLCNTGAGCGTVFSLSPISQASQFVPFPPCRVIDTRWWNSPLLGGTTNVFDLATYASLLGCDDLSSATAFSLNITVVPHGPLGYLTVWPNSSNQPVASLLNSPDGRVKANAAVVAGSSVNPGHGWINVYASDTTDVIIDVNGYFTTPSSQTLQFYPLPPCRAIDTRNGQDGGMLQAGVERDYTMAERCGIPTTALAYSLNVTVLPAPGGLDYLTVWTPEEPRPSTSTLNASAGGPVANAAIVTADKIIHGVAFYANSNNTDLLVDVNGYFATPGDGGNSLYTVPDCRIYDSRYNNGQPFSGHKTIDIAVQPCTPPMNTQAYVFNATVVPSGPMPYLTLWPHGESEPTVSTLNAFDGLTTSNMALVATSDGSIDAYAAGLTQMILDISGFFAP